MLALRCSPESPPVVAPPAKRLLLLRDRSPVGWGLLSTFDRCSVTVPGWRRQSPMASSDQHFVCRCCRTSRALALGHRIPDRNSSPPIVGETEVQGCVWASEVSLQQGVSSCSCLLSSTLPSPGKLAPRKATCPFCRGSRVLV